MELSWCRDLQNQFLLLARSETEGKIIHIESTFSLQKQFLLLVLLLLSGTELAQYRDPTELHCFALQPLLFLLLLLRSETERIISLSLSLSVCLSVCLSLSLSLSLSLYFQKLLWSPEAGSIVATVTVWN